MDISILQDGETNEYRKITEATDQESLLTMLEDFLEEEVAKWLDSPMPVNRLGHLEKAVMELAKKDAEKQISKIGGLRRPPEFHKLVKENTNPDILDIIENLRELQRIKEAQSKVNSQVQRVTNEAKTPWRKADKLSDKNIIEVNQDEVWDYLYDFLEWYTSSIDISWLYSKETDVLTGSLKDLVSDFKQNLEEYLTLCSRLRKIAQEKVKDKTIGSIEEENKAYNKRYMMDKRDLFSFNKFVSEGGNQEALDIYNRIKEMQATWPANANYSLLKTSILLEEEILWNHSDQEIREVAWTWVATPGRLYEWINADKLIPIDWNARKWVTWWNSEKQWEFKKAS